MHCSLNFAGGLIISLAVTIWVGITELFLSASNNEYNFQSCWRAASHPCFLFIMEKLQHGTYMGISVTEGAETQQVHRSINPKEGAETQQLVWSTVCHGRHRNLKISLIWSQPWNVLFTVFSVYFWWKALNPNSLPSRTLNRRTKLKFLKDFPSQGLNTSKSRQSLWVASLMSWRKSRISRNSSP